MLPHIMLTRTSVQSAMNDVLGVSLRVCVETCEPAVYSTKEADTINDWMTKCAIFMSLISTLDEVHAVLRSPELFRQYVGIQVMFHVFTPRLVRNRDDLFPPLKGERWLGEAYLSD